MIGKSRLSCTQPELSLKSIVSSKVPTFQYAKVQVCPVHHWWTALIEIKNPKR